MLKTYYSREQLAGYLVGQLGDELSGQIELHVGDCPTCDDTLTELDSTGDTLIRTLRLKSAAVSQDSPAWIEDVARGQHAEIASETTDEPPHDWAITSFNV